MKVILITCIILTSFCNFTLSLFLNPIDLIKQQYIELKTNQIIVDNPYSNVEIERYSKIHFSSVINNELIKSSDKMIYYFNYYKNKFNSVLEVEDNHINLIFPFIIENQSNNIISETILLSDNYMILNDYLRRISNDGNSINIINDLSKFLYHLLKKDINPKNLNQCIYIDTQSLKLFFIHSLSCIINSPKFNEPSLKFENNVYNSYNAIKYFIETVLRNIFNVQHNGLDINELIDHKDFYVDFNRNTGEYTVSNEAYNQYYFIGSFLDSLYLDGHLINKYSFDKFDFNYYYQRLSILTKPDQYFYNVLYGFFDNYSNKKYNPNDLDSRSIPFIHKDPLSYMDFIDKNIMDTSTSTLSNIKISSTYTSFNFRPEFNDTVYRKTYDFDLINANNNDGDDDLLTNYNLKNSFLELNNNLKHINKYLAQEKLDILVPITTEIDLNANLLHVFYIDNQNYELDTNGISLISNNIGLKLEESFMKFVTMYEYKDGFNKLRSIIEAVIKLESIGLYLDPNYSIFITTVDEILYFPTIIPNDIRPLIFRMYLYLRNSIFSEAPKQNSLEIFEERDFLIKMLTSSLSDTLIDRLWGSEFMFKQFHHALDTDIDIVDERLLQINSLGLDISNQQLSSKIQQDLGELLQLSAPYFYLSPDGYVFESNIPVLRHEINHFITIVKNVLDSGYNIFTYSSFVGTLEGEIYSYTLSNDNVAIKSYIDLITSKPFFKDFKNLPITINNAFLLSIAYPIAKEFLSVEFPISFYSGPYKQVANLIYQIMKSDNLEDLYLKGNEIIQLSQHFPDCMYKCSSYSEAQIDDLVQSEHLVTSDCLICYDKLSKQTFLAHECRNGFHSSCLSYWKLINPTCPTCKDPL